MKRIEYILIGIFLSGFIMNLFFLTGGGILLVLSASILAVLYYPGGLFLFNNLSFKGVFKKETYSGLSVLRVIGSVVAGIALSMICIGILFRLQSWPASGINLLAGLSVLLIVGIIAAYKFMAKEATVYKGILTRAIVYGILGLGLFLTSSEDIERFRYRNHPDYLDLYEKHLQDPDNRELWKQLDEAHNRVAASD